MKALLRFLIPSWMLCGLGFDGGDSSSTSTTYQTDNRRVIGDSGISAEDSIVSTSNFSYTENLGGEVVDASLNFAGDTVTDSLKLVDRTTDTAFNFGGDALDRTLNTVDRTTDTAFTFAGDTLAGAYQFGTAAMANVANIADASIGAAAASTKSAQQLARLGLETSQDTFGNALAFGAGTLAKAFDAASETGAFVKDAYADAKGRGALTDKILIGALIAMAVVAIYAGRRG